MWVDGTTWKFIIFFIRISIKLNRTPFDLIEDESELVSDFNIEYII